jgi:F0F1-type ATP synthase membrane subunit c/vacuolar-type H+-ATPase subunit K
VHISYPAPATKGTHPNGGKFPSQPPTGIGIGGVTAAGIAATQQNPDKTMETNNFLKGLKPKDQMQITRQKTYQISRALSQPLRASAAAIVVAAAAAAVSLMATFHHRDWASPNPTAV